MKTFKLNLKSLLKERGLQQKVFAKQIGLSKYKIHHMCTNKKKAVELFTLYIICQGLDCNLEDMVIVDEVE